MHITGTKNHQGTRYRITEGIEADHRNYPKSRSNVKFKAIIKRNLG